MSSWSRHSSRTERTRRSATALARGDLIGAHNLDPFRRKDGIKGSTVLAIVIPDEMSKSLLLCLQVPDELARLLG